MTLRNAALRFLTPVLFMMSAAAQEQSATVAGASPGVSLPPVEISFTGHLLGYYRLPEWQSADFETDCPHPQNFTVANQRSASDPVLNGTNSIFTPADAFLSDDYRPRGDVLVGMGDNFGVTLESRAWRHRDALDQPWQLHSKARRLEDKNWDTAPADEIGDNVGCFFYRAGYDAIVPGKDDFYFGPERLRRIASRLANAPQENGLHPVRMLAANLVLKTDYLKKQPEIQDSDKGLKFVPGMPSGIKSMDISDNGTLPPFARQIRFQVSPTSFYSLKADSLHHFEPFLCPVGNQEGLDRLDPADCTSKVMLQGATLESKPTADKQIWDFDLPSTVWPPKELPALFGLCAKIDPDELKQLGGAYAARQGKKNDYYCARFTAVDSLFGDAHTDPWVLRPLKPDPARPGSKPGYAVIFGVVDKELTTLVGRDNLSWRNNEPKTYPGQMGKKNPVPPGKETYGTTVDALDEASTLGIAVRSFDLFWRANHAGEPLVRILLAQMGRGNAENLAANLANTQISDTSLRFDVVISAAAARSEASADEEVTFHRPLKPDNAKAGDTSVREFRQFVAVPWLGYESSRVPDPIRTLRLTDSGCSAGPCDRRTFVLGGNYHKTFPLSEAVDHDQLETCYDILGHSYLERRKYWQNPKPGPAVPLASPTCPVVANQGTSDTASSRPSESKPPAAKYENAFQLAVLAILRDRTHADVAMLQKRSFYFGPFPAPLDGVPATNWLTHANGELLERILWMGDFLEVLSVKGSTLKKILDESDKLDAIDEQATHEVVEISRGVLALGLEKTRDKQYLIDGMQLDPARLYTVATSNHIAAGDNGYPELAEFADARLPSVDKDQDADDRTPHISTVVCEELGGDQCVTNLGLLFASIEKLPSQLVPALPSFFKAYVRSVRGEPELPGDAFNRTNYEAQLNPNWRFSLKDFSFNLSSVRNNLSEVQRVTDLGGVTEPGAGNAKSHTIDFSTHAEWVRSGRWLDEFIRGLSEYQDTFTGSTATVPITGPNGLVTDVLYPAPALITRSKNQLAIDPGLFWHPAGHKYFDKLGMVVEPLHFDTQLASQVLQFAAAYSPTGVVTVPAINELVPKNRNFLSRIAFRGESDKNHFEIGYQGGWERNGLESLTTNLGTCPALMITLCVETQESQPGFLASSLRLAAGTRERNGPYWDMDWTLPLIWKLGFQTKESFQYFGPAHMDNAIDTLYRNDVTETLNLKLMPNLSIGPSLERFDYENKIEHVHLRTWSPSIKLTYSFDVLEGSHWKKSLAYSPSAGGGKSE